MGGGQVFFLLTVALLGVTALGSPIENHNNETEIEGEFPEDILEKWLRNFGTYTFMVDHDADDEGNETLLPEVTSSAPGENGEEDEDDYEPGSSAPISLIVEDGIGLLNQELDYIVKLESLVAEGGYVLVTLAGFKNKTICGVGGFTLNTENRERGSQEGRLNISHQQNGNRSTTFVAFNVDNEAENTGTWKSGDKGSSWEELGQNLRWATGKLEGGGLLTLTFTPPECGCVMLKAHYALPIGDNLTLVVGPEAYSLDLERLLCIDPALTSMQETSIETEGAEEDSLQNEVEKAINIQEDEDDLVVEGSAAIARGRGRLARRKAAKKARRAKRKEARQAIRQAGKRVTKKRIMKQMRLQRRHDESEENVENRNGRQGGKWAREQSRKAAKKQAKQARKKWRKQRKQRRNKHRRRNKPNRHQNATEDAAEDIEDHSNETLALTEEDDLADLLLSDEGEEKEEPEAGVSGDDMPNRRRGRKHRRQRGKPKNKLQNKEQKKAVKFCCKRGIKFKKSQLSNNTDDGEQPEIICNDANDIISTYAEHQFGIDKSQCATRFETCCSNFSSQLWENVKARKAKRKKQRKFRQNQRRRHGQHSTSTTASITQ